MTVEAVHARSSGEILSKRISSNTCGVLLHLLLWQ
jgi:hypothetical protein